MHGRRPSSRHANRARESAPAGRSLFLGVGKGNLVFLRAGPIPSFPVSLSSGIKKRRPHETDRFSRSRTDGRALGGGCQEDDDDV